MSFCIGAVVHDLSVDGASIGLIKGDRNAGIAAELTNIEGDHIVVGGNHAGIALKDDITVVEAQRVILAAHLVGRIDLHIFQGQIRVVLNDALDVVCALRDPDGAVLEGDGGILQKLEGVRLRVRGTRARPCQGIGMLIEIQNELFAGRN